MSRLRVLIAEDEAIIRLDLKEILEELGHIVVGEAWDGETALELAETLKPDLAILDIKMPGMNGIEVARLITAAGICPVVMLTAYSQKSLIDEAIKAGAMAYLVKPFNKSDLLPAIEVARSRFLEMQELEKQVRNLEDRLETRKLVERAKGTLMKKLDLDEASAFRQLQKWSMDKQLSLKQVAESILKAEEQI
ncbi:MAG: response regulator [Firmicutes bacterium]|nr:response regulator [Bacillota bacterium]